MVGEMFQGFLHDFRTWLDWVGGIPKGVGDRQVAYLACQDFFYRMGWGFGTEPCGKKFIPHPEEGRDRQDDHYSQADSYF